MLILTQDDPQAIAVRNAIQAGDLETLNHLLQEHPDLARWLLRLASFTRVIMFDKRGTGLSDPVSEVPSLDLRMDDVRAVMDAAGSESAALLGVSEGGALAEDALQTAKQAMERRKGAPPVSDAVTPPSLETPHGQLWVTRSGVYVDRLACAWLMRQFIDPKCQAESRE